IACSGDPSGLRPPYAPAIEAASVAPNLENVLSAVVTLRARRADSALVRFRLAHDPPSSADSVTPAVVVAGGSAVLPASGPLPSSSYVARVVAYGPGGVTASDDLSFTTDALPADLPSYEAGGSD